MPIFSIIIPCYNSATYIRENLRSVLNQSFVDYEIIIVDNVSVDDTLAIIKSFDDDRIQIVSEPDNGIYDAMNKGLSLRNGELVHILNSDDKYSSDTVLQDIFDEFKLRNVDIIYSGIRYVSRNGDRKLHKWIPTRFNKLLLMLGWHPPHPGVFVHSRVYQSVGNFKTEYGVTGDYEWLLRVFNNDMIQTKLLKKICVDMRLGGASDKDFLTKLNGWISVFNIHRVVFNSSILSLLAIILRIATKLIRQLRANTEK